jgi:DNA-binding NarL/FixJ family response regulator
VPAAFPARSGRDEGERRQTANLSAREVEILTLMAQGLFNHEIASHLFLARETVKTHIHHLLGKLGARSRTHAVAIGLRQGLIEDRPLPAGRDLGLDRPVRRPVRGARRQLGSDRR